MSTRLTDAGAGEAARHGQQRCHVGREDVVVVGMYDYCAPFRPVWNRLRLELALYIRECADGAERKIARAN